MNERNFTGAIIPIDVEEDPEDVEGKGDFVERDFGGGITPIDIEDDTKNLEGKGDNDLASIVENLPEPYKIPGSNSISTCHIPEEIFVNFGEEPTEDFINNISLEKDNSQGEELEVRGQGQKEVSNLIPLVNGMTIKELVEILESDGTKKYNKLEKTERDNSFKVRKSGDISKAEKLKKKNKCMSANKSKRRSHLRRREENQDIGQKLKYGL